MRRANLVFEFFFLSFILSIILPASTGLAQPFLECTAEAGISYNQYATLVDGRHDSHYMSGGAAVADYDGDGWLDLYATRMDELDILYRNQGDGTFVEVPVEVSGIQRFRGSNGASWADIDNDGDPDLYVSTLGRSQNYLYVNQGDGSFLEEAVGRGVAMQDTIVATRGYSATFADYDQDGYLDLHTTSWRDPNGRGSRLFRNRGSDQPGHFEDVTDLAGVDITGVSYSWGFTSQFSDLDGDGDLDLAATSDYEHSRLFWNNGDGTFSDGTQTARVATDENGMGSCIGDFDGDGRLDWFVTSIFDTNPFAANWGVSGNRLYQNRGDCVFQDATDTAQVRDGGWGWGTVCFDYDRDGDLDLSMTNGVRFPDNRDSEKFENDPMRLWTNLGDAQFAETSSAMQLDDTASGKALLTFDYDRDGDLDLFVVNTAESPKLYRNDCSNDFSWLSLCLHGSTSNSAGWGSRVEVTTAERTQVHEVSGGVGFLSQNAVPLFVGLGTAPVIEVLVIHWPSGYVQTLTDVEVDRELCVFEETSEMPRPADLSLQVGRNPSRGRVMLRFSLPAHGAARLEVFDARGRLLHRIVSETLQPGSHVRFWDGRGPDERLTAAGIYFARLTTSTSSRQVRFVRLR